MEWSQQVYGQTVSTFRRLGFWELIGCCSTTSGTKRSLVTNVRLTQSWRCPRCGRGSRTPALCPWWTSWLQRAGSLADFHRKSLAGQQRRWVSAHTPRLSHLSLSSVCPILPDKLWALFLTTENSECYNAEMLVWVLFWDTQEVRRRPYRWSGWWRSGRSFLHSLCRGQTKRCCWSFSWSSRRAQSPRSSSGVWAACWRPPALWDLPPHTHTRKYTQLT